MLSPHLPGLELGADLLIGLGIGAHQLGNRQRERRKGLERRLHAVVGDPSWLELAFDPPPEPHLAHTLHVTRARAIAQAVQSMRDLLVLGQRALRQREADGARRLGSSGADCGRRTLPGERRIRAGLPSQDGDGDHGQADGACSHRVAPVP